MYPYKSSHDVIAWHRIQAWYHTRNSIKTQAKREDDIAAVNDNNVKFEVQTNQIKRFIQAIKIRYAEYKIMHRSQINRHRMKEFHDTKQYMHNVIRQKTTDMKIYARDRTHRERRGGMHMDSDDEPQTPLSSLNKCKAEWLEWGEESENIDKDSETHSEKDEWQFIQALAPNIRVDEDEDGRLLFRRYDHGLLITREEMIKCIELVQQARTIQDINERIEVQALYRSS